MGTRTGSGQSGSAGIKPVLLQLRPWHAVKLTCVETRHGSPRQCCRVFAKNLARSGSLSDNREQQQPSYLRGRIILEAMTSLIGCSVATSQRQSTACHGAQRAVPSGVSRGQAGLVGSPSTFVSAALTIRSKPTLSVLQHRAGRQCVTVSAGPDIQAYVWGAPSGDKPWACPICHSLLLAINEKTLSYDRIYVDYQNLPDWFAKENPDGKMPLIKDQASEKYIGGLDNIINYLEDKFSEPSIGKLSQSKSPSTIPETDIAGLWQAYKAYAHAREQDVDNDADDARAPFENRLAEVADALKENGGKFFGKDYVDSTDLVLGPRLNHIYVVLKHLHKEWAFPPGSEVLESYVSTIRDLPSWKVTAYDDNDVISYYNEVVKPKGSQ